MKIKKRMASALIGMMLLTGCVTEPKVEEIEKINIEKQDIEKQEIEKQEIEKQEIEKQETEKQEKEKIEEIEKDENKNENDIVQKEAQEKEENIVIDDDIEDNIEEEYQEFTFEEYLGKDREKLTDEQFERGEKLFQQIEAEYMKEEFDEDMYYISMEILAEFLRDCKVVMPYYSFQSFVEENSEYFTKEDIKKVIELDRKIADMYIEAVENQEEDKLEANEEYKKLNEEFEDIFEQAGFIYEEVETQIQNQSIQLALFDVNDQQITLSKNSILKGEDITEAQMKKYKAIFQHVQEIVPEKYMNMLTTFEINTDGEGNVMAHVVPEADDASVWRLAIDIKDSLDAEDKMVEELTRTIVHEMAHVMTLNKEQLRDSVDETVATYITDEGQLKKDSYLNLFYQKFWKNMKDEHAKMLEESQDGAYEFYEKYSQQFVSDYAATNPGEDIAESYRVFVLEKKPDGNEVKDQKILFFYAFEEVVNGREMIRKNLGLE